MIDMVEPTDPTERATAIKICRANCYLDPETGAPELDPAKQKENWRVIQNEVPYKKWIWMWNHGRKEWDPRFSDRDGERQ